MLFAAGAVAFAVAGDATASLDLLRA